MGGAAPAYARNRDTWVAGTSPARRNHPSTLSPHFLGGLSEHVPARLLVERLLDEFAERKTGLHLRPRPDFGVPALDVRLIVERKALRLVRHGPWKAGDVGNRIIAGDVSPGLAELGIE